MTKSQELKEIEELREKILQTKNEWRENYQKGFRHDNERQKILQEELSELENKLKNKIIDDLPSWAMSPNGRFYRWKEELVSLSGNGKEVIFSNSDDNQEVINRFISEIKNNPQDWEIGEKKWNGEFVNFNDNFDEYFFIVKHKSGRKHYKPKNNFVIGFSFEEWSEIENSIKNQQQAPDNNQEKDQNFTQHQQILPKK